MVTLFVGESRAALQLIDLPGSELAAWPGAELFGAGLPRVGCAKLRNPLHNPLHYGTIEGGVLCHFIGVVLRMTKILSSCGS